MIGSKSIQDDLALKCSPEEGTHSHDILVIQLDKTSFFASMGKSLLDGPFN